MRLIFAGCVLALSACSGGADDTTVVPPAGSVTARFPPGQARDVIQVTVTDRAAARSAELLGPGGLVQPAYSIDTQQTVQTGPTYGGWGFGPSVGIGVGGGSSGFGTGVGFSFPLGVAGMPTTTRQVDQTVTNAFIRVPDTIDYRQNWEAYRIRVEIGDTPENLRPVIIGAPPPPA